jgi:hypothetical protein
MRMCDCVTDSRDQNVSLLVSWVFLDTWRWPGGWECRQSKSDFVEAAAALGVHSCVGRVRLVSVPDAIPETRHAALFVTDDRPNAMSLVYFGVTEALAAGAEQVELYGDHRLLGQLFGYPDCCIEFFLKSGSAGPDRLLPRPGGRRRAQVASQR